MSGTMRNKAVNEISLLLLWFAVFKNYIHFYAVRTAVRSALMLCGRLVSVFTIGP